MNEHINNKSDMYKSQADIADQGVHSTDYDPNLIDKKEKYEDPYINNYTDMPNELLYNDKNSYDSNAKDFYTGPYIAKITGPDNATNKDKYETLHNVDNKNIYKSGKL